jgi:hypothetical protein
LGRRSVQRLIPASASVAAAAIAAATRISAAATGVPTAWIAASRVARLGWVDLDVLRGRAHVLLAGLILAAMVMGLTLAATRIRDRRLDGLRGIAGRRRSALTTPTEEATQEAH